MPRLLRAQRQCSFHLLRSHGGSEDRADAGDRFIWDERATSWPEHDHREYEAQRSRHEDPTDNVDISTPATVAWTAKARIAPTAIRKMLKPIPMVFLSMALPVVAAAGDGVASRAEDHENQSGRNQDHTDRLENGDLGDEANDQDNDAKDDHFTFLLPHVIVFCRFWGVI